MSEREGRGAAAAAVGGGAPCLPACRRRRLTPTYIHTYIHKLTAHTPAAAGVVVMAHQAEATTGVAEEATTTTMMTGGP